MDYSSLTLLNQHNISLKLLRARQMPLILSFFKKAFKSKSAISIPQKDLENQLLNTLHQLRELNDNEDWPLKVAEYLQQWSDAGYLRRYYPLDSDEPIFELTPSVEKVLTWVEIIGQQQAFVGTESRLLMIMDMMSDVVQHTHEDPEEQIASLEKQKFQLNRQIELIRSQGAVKVRL